MLLLKFLPSLQLLECVHDCYHHSLFLFIFSKALPCPICIHTSRRSQQWSQHCFTDGSEQAEVPRPEPEQGNQLPNLLLWGQNGITNRKALWMERKSINARCIIAKPNLSTRWPRYHPQGGMLTDQSCSVSSAWGKHQRLSPARLSLAYVWHHLLQERPIKKKRVTSPLFFKSVAVPLHSTQANPNVRG